MPKAPKILLHQFFTYCSERHLPFAFYRLPLSKSIEVVAQKNRLWHRDSELQKAGFLFSPFREDERFKKVFIEADIAVDEHSLPALEFAPGKINSSKRLVSKQVEAGKRHFLRYIKKIRRKIHADGFRKIVAARIVKKKKPKNFDAVTYFQRLCKAYPNMFVSMISTSQYGLWIGASPEIFLSAKENEMKTYSLAGTQERRKKNSRKLWGKKEIEEQQIVTDYIKNTLKPVTNGKLTIKGPETVSAGNLLHLKTTFTFKPGNSWQQVAELLHPTPAVAGVPQKRAIEFIIKHEKASRGFYSGYLGPVNLNDEVHLFVNIRCMNVLKNKLVVYTGCGITAGSKPEKEWRETKAKAATLLNLL